MKKSKVSDRSNLNKEDGMKKNVLSALAGILLIFSFSAAIAQEVQKVTVTVGDISKEKQFLEPKEITVKPGKVEFTLVNKGEVNHNITIKPKDKEMRLARATPGQTVQSEIVELAPGEYDLYCSFTSGGNHREKGMAGKLIVK